MKAIERFNELRHKKIKFSLNAKMTLLVGGVVLISNSFAFGVSMLLQWLVPDISKIPLIAQLAVLSLVAALVATRLLSKLFFDPIKDLRDGMQRVADGDFSVELETKSSSIEMQELFAGFNMMTQELNSTEILQSDFVSNVSHEFKTPINAIEGYTTLLQGCEKLNGDQQEYVEKILFNTKRLSSLVSNILLLSKIENQAIQSQRQEFCLDEQIREAILELESEWIKKNIDIDNMTIFNQFNYGSYLELNGIKVFMDSRSGIYCEEFTEGSTIMTDYLYVDDGFINYKEIFNKYGITHVMLTNESVINQYICYDSEYECIYQDDNFILYAKNVDI